MSPELLDRTPRRTPRPALRWLALAAVVGNVLYNYLYPRLGLPSMREISDRHRDLFTPAPFAFAIWGVIYAAFVVFAVAAVLPSRRADRAYDRLAGGLAVVNLLAALWITLFAYDLVWPCAAVLAAMLAIAIALYVRADGAVAAGGSAWLRVPFSLLLGWISVATIANLAEALTASGFTGGAVGPAPWAIAMLIVAGALGVAVGVRFRDPVVPVVIAWAAYAIRVADVEASPTVAAVALAVAIASGVTAVAVAVARGVAGRPHLPSAPHRA